MNNKIAYICSPYRGNIKRNKKYARQLVKKAIAEGYAPICPHLYITEVLNDNDATEREQGLRVGLELLSACEAIIVGTKYGISEGMSAEIKEAKRLGLRLFTLNRVNT